MDDIFLLLFESGVQLKSFQNFIDAFFFQNIEKTATDVSILDMKLIIKNNVFATSVFL